MALRRLSAMLLGVVLAVGVQLVVAPPASANPTEAATRVLYYDASQAQEFVSVVHQGARNWNSRVSNVRLEPVPPGYRPHIRVYADDGWPRAYVYSLGYGYWVMGRQAVWQGYYQPRISAHEFGHLLGLPDRRTGRCSDLMSGSSASVSCTNAYPNSYEAAEVESNFGGAAVAPAQAQAFQWEQARHAA